MNQLANSPTTQNYTVLSEAYQFFNERLFSGVLPNCLITMQRKANSYGFFAGGRFGTTDGEGISDELAMNPTHFKGRSTEEVLSTLVHEMCHVWQHHHGKQSRAGYHDRQWAGKMREIGLIPSDTGQPGGKCAGQKVSHYVDESGQFAKHCTTLIDGGYVLPFIELWDEAKAKKNKSKNKTKFCCESCGASAWGKPQLKIIPD
jgi:hypothetical protein